MKISRTSRFLVAASLGGLMLTGAVTGPAAADERICRGTIGATTVDDVKVPQGARCTLVGTRVQGNVKVLGNAALVVASARINGNIQAERAASVLVYTGTGKPRTYVGGSIQIDSGGPVRVLSTTVKGDIQYKQNYGRVTANLNRVGGNIQIESNRGGVEVRRNTVDGNLQCKQNSPAPVGGGNVVKGSKEGQCRLF